MSAALFLVTLQAAGAQPPAYRIEVQDADTLQRGANATRAALSNPGQQEEKSPSSNTQNPSRSDLRNLMDRRTEEIVRKWGDAYRNAAALQYTSVVTFSSRSPREKAQRITTKFWGQKPNLMRAEVQTPQPKEDGVMLSDGRIIWEYCPTLKIYATTPVPEGPFLMQGELYGLRYVPASMMFHPDPFNALIGDARLIRYIGTEKIGKENCYRLWRQLSHGVSVVWLSEDDYLPRRTVRYDVRGGRHVEVYREERSEVAVNTPAAPDKFRFQPPRGWKRHIFPRPEDLLLAPGTEAPDFAALDHTGTEVRLSSQRGKTVVLLFWSVYCPICRSELEDLNKIQTEFAEKDVLVIALNAGDYPEAIKDYHAENPNTEAALWRDPKESRERSSLYPLFGVRGIPTTYVLDAKGKVVSAWSGYDDKKSAELRALLTRMTSQ